MSTHRCDRYTERGPYIAWLCKIDDGEYTITVQIADRPPESADTYFATEERLSSQPTRSLTGCSSSWT